MEYEPVTYLLLAGLWYISFAVNTKVLHTCLIVTSERARCFSMQMTECIFIPPKTSQEQGACVANAILRFAQYKNKWAAGIIEDPDFPKYQRWNQAISLNTMICTKFSR